MNSAANSLLKGLVDNLTKQVKGLPKKVNSKSIFPINKDLGIISGQNLRTLDNKLEFKLKIVDHHAKEESSPEFPVPVTGQGHHKSKMLFWEKDFHSESYFNSALNKKNYQSAFEENIGESFLGLNIRKDMINNKDFH